MAETVALFERRDPQHTAAEVDSSNCRLLAQILENANASELLPNFVAAEFNDNDGACIRLLQFLTSCASFPGSKTSARATVTLAWSESSANRCVFVCSVSLEGMKCRSFNMKMSQFQRRGHSPAVFVSELRCYL